MIQVQNLSKSYNGTTVLKIDTLEIPKGQSFGLVGNNGAGKTTTLRTIAGLMQPRQGSVVFAGENVYLSKPHQIISKGISMVPEGRGIFAKMTVAENLEMGAFYRNDRESIQKDIEHAYELFPRLSERRKQLAGTMSGGEQQMLSTARALMAKPKLILMDEPSMGLAPVLVDLIFETIQRINKEGVTVLLVEQNALMSLSIAHRGYVLQTGEIVLSDHAKALKNNPSVQKAYLGID